MSLAFASNVTKLTAVATIAGEYWVTITARTDGVISYTEIYDDETIEAFAGELLSAGHTIYGRFLLISTASGHVVVGR